MILRLDIERLRTLEEVRDFLAGSDRQSTFTSWTGAAPATSSHGR